MGAQTGNRDIAATDVFNRLDQLSRTRALTDYESELLEEAMDAIAAGQWNLRLNARDAARYGVKRRHYRRRQEHELHR